MPDIYHEYRKGKQEHIGTLIFRDDECVCGCIRRLTLDNNNKEVVDSYSKNDNITLEEPPCTRKVRKKYKSKTKYISNFTTQSPNDERKSKQDIRSRGTKKDKSNNKTSRRKI